MFIDLRATCVEMRPRERDITGLDWRALSKVTETDIPRLQVVVGPDMHCRFYIYLHVLQITVEVVLCAYF